MRLLVRVVAALILIGLLILMLGPFGEAQARTGIWDKAAHVVAFILIPICLAINLPFFGRLVTLGLASLLLGGAIEIVQGWVGRDASWGDLLADGVGILCALALLAMLRAWKSRPQTPLSA